MVERHKLFVIARVGKHYRCLAVVSHQYPSLQYRLALGACLRLIAIFSDQANRRPLEMELRLAADFYRDEEEPPEEMLIDTFERILNRARPVRFPFITTCLVVGASTAGLDSDLDRWRVSLSAVFSEPADTGFDKGDNSSGITILDITDLDNVRYCFAAWQRIRGRPWGSNSDTEFSEESGRETPPPLNTPWSASSEYGRNYVTGNSRSEVTDKFAGTPLIRASALADVWPWGKWVTDQRTETHKTEESSPTPTGGPSLEDQALAKLVQSILSCARVDDITLLDEPMRTPTFKESLRSRQYAIKMASSDPQTPQCF
ncbi:hypothetical protein C8A00DRAFT_34604 [Chaetomidium leptoderma]|uniref:Uncharacterized protein n=1 Tax=Chaetomidium leptoderma TaxID=669021 RepID=A0AAN6VJH6_9PEZI|nr:hypothetical protein C8A00DRAFT_34604 [Chaetomidium leptoderma]